MDIADTDVEAFGPSNQGRAFNDSENKSRERVVIALINSPNAALDSLRSQIRNKELLNDLVTALSQSLTELANLTKLKFKPDNVMAIKKGGRGNNHDLDLVVNVNGTHQTLAVELKKGKTLFDQPQFLSLYVNSPNVLTDQVENYAEFFFDRYFKTLHTYSGCDKVEKAEYLTGVWGTSYGTPPFSQLYNLVHRDNRARSYFRELQYSSIDAYISYVVGSLPCPINWDSLQERLYQQLPKYFLSWNSQVKTFKWEQFQREELTLTRDVKTKAKASGQLTSIVLPTETAQRLEMLLRWKNNPCVKGPAWQIKLTPP